MSAPDKWFGQSYKLNVHGGPWGLPNFIFCRGKSTRLWPKYLKAFGSQLPSYHSVNFRANGQLSAVTSKQQPQSCRLFAFSINKQCYIWLCPYTAHSSSPTCGTHTHHAAWQMECFSFWLVCLPQTTGEFVGTDYWNCIHWTNRIGVHPK